MPDPTVFSIPRRRMALGPYVGAGVERPPLRDVGIINSGEVVFNREVNDYRSVSVSGGQCREYVADSNEDVPDGTLTVEMMSSAAANLGVMLSSDVAVVPVEPVVDEPFATAVNDDVFQLSAIPDPETFVLTDSDAGPATLVEGVDWEWVSDASGMLRILDIGSYVQPFLASYTPAAAESINPMTKLDSRYRVVLSGANQRNSCKGEFEDFYRARISEAQTKRLHEAADVKEAQPMTVVFTVDRDPARNYEFSNFSSAN